jgi:ribosomal-protein-alanine N-acetyltransferase
MRHKGTVPLETPRLLLRRLLAQDAPAMYANWAGDPDVTRHLRWNPHADVRETAQILRAWAELYPNPDYYQWAVTEKSGGTLVGSLSIFDDGPNEGGARALWRTDGADPAAGVWMPGYCYGKAWWGRGYATEALRAAADYWFGAVGGAWLACCHDADNPASGRVMEHAGFVFDHAGTDHKFDGTPVPCRYYALTRARWQALRAASAV